MPARSTTSTLDLSSSTAPPHRPSPRSERARTPSTTRVTVLASAGVDDDGRLVELVRAGDEAAFADLVHRYQPRLLRFAEVTVGNRAIAEEVCQETWLAVVRGVARFEGRSSFKTWLFRILLNRARAGARMEARAGR